MFHFRFMHCSWTPRGPWRDAIMYFPSEWVATISLRQ